MKYKKINSEDVTTGTVPRKNAKPFLLYKGCEYGYRRKQKVSFKEGPPRKVEFEVYYCTAKNCKMILRKGFDDDDESVVFYVSCGVHCHGVDGIEGDDENTTVLVSRTENPVDSTEPLRLIEDTEIDDKSEGEEDEREGEEQQYTKEWLIDVVKASSAEFLDRFCKESLDQEQMRITKSSESLSVLLNAGPGSGKTRTLAGIQLQIMKKYEAHDCFLSLCFARVAKRQSIDRLVSVFWDEDLEVIESEKEKNKSLLKMTRLVEDVFNIYTFHEYCFKKYRTFRRESDNVEIVLFEEDLAEKAVTNILELGEFSFLGNDLKKAMDGLQRAIIDKYTGNENNTDPKFSDMYRVYRERVSAYEREGQEWYSFFEIIMLFVLKSRRREIKMDENIKCIIIDEAQDLDWSLIEAAKILCLDNQIESVSVAMDEHQSIFSFNGLFIPDIMKEIEDSLFYILDYENFSITTNHRSKKNIEYVCKKLVGILNENEIDEDFEKCVFILDCKSYKEQMRILTERIRRYLTEFKNTGETFAILCRTTSPLKSLKKKFEYDDNVNFWRSGDFKKISTVNLVTIFMSKSAEFDVVDVMDCIDYMHPFLARGAQIGINEDKIERNVLMVAASRAKNELNFCHYEDAEGHPSFRTGFLKGMGLTRYLREQLGSFVKRKSEEKTVHRVVGICRTLASINLDDYIN